MIKKLAWETFKNTGDINTFLEFVEVKNLEENILKKEKAEIYGDNKDDRSCDTRK